MPARTTRTTSAPSSPTVPAHRVTADVPSRLGAPSPAPVPEHATPESCDAQFELIGEIVSDLRESVLATRESSDTNARAELEQQCTALMAKLRGAQRRALLGLEHLREMTKARGVDADPARVRCATSAYELAYHRAQIKAQEDYEDSSKNAKLGVDLMDLKEFETDAKSRGMKVRVRGVDEHELTLRRLEHELLVRKEMEAEAKALEVELSELKSEVAQKRQLIVGGAVRDSMEALRRAAEPLRRKFDLPYTTTQKVDEKVELLPVPLYVLYAQLKHVQQAYEENISVEIVGRVEDARAMKERVANEEDVEEDTGTHNRRHGNKRRRGPQGRKQETSSVYDEFPLRVILGVSGTEITFSYLVRLHVVVSHCKQKRNLLVDLFPDDDGTTMPNNASASTVPSDFAFDFSCTYGEARPFMWAQHLAGLSFLPPLPRTITEDETQKIIEKADALRVVQTLKAKISSGR